MKAYSLDLRTRVIAAVDSGMARSDVVTTFQVSLGTLKRWLRMRRETGTVTARPRIGRQVTFTPADEVALRQRLTDVPDATLDELVVVWAQQYGVRVSRWTISRALVRIGWTRKKSR